MTLALLGFALGTVWASFTQAALGRIAQGQSLGGWSQCDHCQTRLGPLELVPVVGWLWLKGRCRHCQGGIAVQYPLFEFCNGLLLALAVWGQTPAWPLLLQLLVLQGLIALAYEDAVRGEVPLFLVFFCLLAAGAKIYLTGSDLLHPLTSLLWGAGGMFWIRTLYFYVRGQEGLGEGDVSLLGLLGFLLGAEALIPLVFVASLAAALFSLLQLARNTKGLQSQIAFGPWLIGTGLVFLLFPAIPRGLALGAG